MKIRVRHSWDLTREEALALQRELAPQVDQTTPLKKCQVVAAADVSSEWRSNLFFAGVVVVRLRDMAVLEKQSAVRETAFPYHSGLLTFREAPALLEAFARVRSTVDAVMIDGQGLAHPRRCGLASHVGLWLDLPTVGCAKSRLTGQFEEPDWKAGSTSPLLLHNEIIGNLVRTKNGVRPLFVSVGNRIDLDSAVQVVLKTCRGYRLPEPARQAHQFVNELRRQGV